MIFVTFFYVFIIGLSLVIDIILVFINKKYIYDESPKNWILLIVALFLLVCIFYTSIITTISVFSKNPNICSLQLEIKEASFMFAENSGDFCINSVVKHAKLTTIEFCDSIEENSHKTRCIANVAFNTGDISYCYNIEEAEESDRRFFIDWCLTRIAVDNGNVSICELEEIDDKDACRRDVDRGN